MTLTAPVSPELADTPCTVAECLEPASHMASATVRVDPSMRAPADFHTITFGLPVCPDHAALLQRGCTLTEFTSGL